MAKQASQGKAFEYACLNRLHRYVSRHQRVVVKPSKALESARNAYYSIDDCLRNEMNLGAGAAVGVICKLEPRLLHDGEGDVLELSIVKDTSGAAGDVRDVLARRHTLDWEIGISAKHNHDAVKHSRLSNTIDFGESWFGTPCNSEYFDEIGPIFKELEQLREQNLKWSQLENKVERFYYPILQAFIRELNRLYEQHGSRIPQELLRYLIGRHDFYKVIANTKNRVTKIQAFSFLGTLNLPAGNTRALYRIPQIRLPEVIYNVDFKRGSSTTLSIVCDQGWTLSARIHNASTMVEPSLKFDIKLTGLPPTVYSHDEPWGMPHNGNDEQDDYMVAEESGEFE